MKRKKKERERNDWCSFVTFFHFSFFSFSSNLNLINKQGRMLGPQLTMLVLVSVVVWRLRGLLSLPHVIMKGIKYFVPVSYNNLLQKFAPNEAARKRWKTNWMLRSEDVKKLERERRTDPSCPFLLFHSIFPCLCLSLSVSVSVSLSLCLSLCADSRLLGADIELKLDRKVAATILPEEKTVTFFFLFLCHHDK